MDSQPNTLPECDCDADVDADAAGTPHLDPLHEAERGLFARLLPLAQLCARYTLCPLSASERPLSASDRPLSGL